MITYIANTDLDWFRFLSRLEDLDEVNFWRPLGETPFKALKEGEPLLFKLKKNDGNAIVGFGTFVGFVGLSVPEAWSVFGTGNGVGSERRMWERVRHYVTKIRGAEPSLHHRIGCILLAGPVFFPESLWIRIPDDWAQNIVGGKTYDGTVGEGRRVWEDCLYAANQISAAETAAYNLSLFDEKERYGTGQLIRPRLGQGSFRYAIQRAYGRCAVTGEHALPALEAAHIVPYAAGGVHELPNGLLLRADIHKLYDRGYVTVTPDHRFHVSTRLDDEYHNGKIYYQLEGSKIWVPSNPADGPKKDNLEYHREMVFLG